MAFHVACPIACRRICFCSLGFPQNLHGGKAKDVFLKGIHSLDELSRDPWGVGVSRETTVQVRVPKVAVPAQAPVLVDAALQAVAGDGGEAAVEDAALAVSAQTKRTSMQRKAAVAMVAAEDYARRFGSGDAAAPSKDLDGEDHDYSGTSMMCHMCFLVENEGSERAKRMLSCKKCGKKYHRSCLKSWAQHRDLFHWSSWTCPSCRICEFCRRIGDPSKFMFCKRCDAAYHCYCQQPRHKNVSSGPYLCPTHIKCHNCGSTVPGNGLSVRWFLGYTCCDACGRLFAKGNYCPVCLKVYRDSESTPMVCCDICQHWVHCQCDGISDEKYLQFQVDGNLQYKCATCRGECYQVKDLQDAVQELWKRKDMADRELITSLRAASGLAVEEEKSFVCPSFDDEENGPMVGHSLKFTFKGLADKPQKRLSSTKMYSKQKMHQASAASKSEAQRDSGGCDGYHLDDERRDNSSRSFQVVGRSESALLIKQPSVPKVKFTDKAMVSDEAKPSKILRIKSSRSHDSDSEDTGKHSNELNTMRAKKLVINLGPRKVNVTKPLSCDASNPRRQQEHASNGDGLDQSGHTGSLKNSGKFGKLKLEETVSPEQDHAVLGKFSEERKDVPGSKADVPLLKGEGGSMGRHLESRGDLHGGVKDDREHMPALHSLEKDSRPLLRFKIRKLNAENQDSCDPIFVDERDNSTKGQRSKRKRLSAPMEKSSLNEDEDVSLSREDSLVDEMLDASWILKKLGKDAKGKRVEIHQASDNSWHKGVVTDVMRGTSTLSVTLESGKLKTLELGKQGVRFVPQKQKRTRT